MGLKWFDIFKLFVVLICIDVDEGFDMVIVVLCFEGVRCLVFFVIFVFEIVYFIELMCSFSVYEVCLLKVWLLMIDGVMDNLCVYVGILIEIVDKMGFVILKEDVYCLLIIVDMVFYDLIEKELLLCLCVFEFKFEMFECVWWVIIDLLFLGMVLIEMVCVCLIMLKCSF